MHSMFTAVDYHVIYGDLFVPYLYYALTNVIPVVIGAILVTYMEVNDFRIRFSN